ncbi:MAG: alkaline phosphatase family protein [Planctomycetes bacterium]|nr:alkaline phosphatase family protein [Planctomycetota bacterium]
MPRFLLLLLLAVAGALPAADIVVPTAWKTRHVVVLVIDGPRWSETWGKAGRDLIPVRAQVLAPQGVLLNNMANNGPTYTNAGHSALTTGFYQEINNSGLELPRNPSITQRLIAAGADPQQVWVVSSKDKLQILTDSTAPGWNHRHLCSADCGKDGAGSGYREDQVTLERTKAVLSKHRPRYLLINFREPDSSGHAKKWDAYLANIKTTDDYAGQVWAHIQADPQMKDVTTLFITNDHGRHLDGHKDGYISHGDDCVGCRKIELLAIGPDFKRGVTADVHRSQIDIAVTSAALLGLTLPASEGKLMSELFAQPPGADAK